LRQNPLGVIIKSLSILFSMSFRLLYSPALPWQEVHLIKFTPEVSTTFL